MYLGYLENCETVLSALYFNASMPLSSPIWGKFPPLQQADYAAIIPDINN
jgi:hypothetical protein